MSPGSRPAPGSLHHHRSRPALEVGRHGRPRVRQSCRPWLRRVHRPSGLPAGIHVHLVRPAHDRLRRPGLHGLVLK